MVYSVAEGLVSPLSDHPSLYGVVAIAAIMGRVAIKYAPHMANIIRAWKGD
jgi:hypothetical protein